jgi:formylglycine-generating enzyme required for sulfatase activity
MHRWRAGILKRLGSRPHRLWTATLVPLLVSASIGLSIAAAEAAAPPARTTFRDCPNCPEMVVIPAGTFLMGSSDADTARDLAPLSWFNKLPLSWLHGLTARWSFAQEHPQHPVRIAQPFGLALFPVTRGEFAAFVRATGYAAVLGCIVSENGLPRWQDDADWQSPGFRQTDRDPVVCVSWSDAQAYVSWLNEEVRRGTNGGRPAGPYHLPTEAEWEYAARAGQQTARWWGNDVGSDNAVCDGCGSRWDEKSTAPVGSLRPNQFGLFDMLGNVWEWTEDCWNPRYVGAPSDGEARTTGDCTHRVMRGGDWAGPTWMVRSASRATIGLSDASNFFGFRVAKTLP